MPPPSVVDSSITGATCFCELCYDQGPFTFQIALIVLHTDVVIFAVLARFSLPDDAAAFLHLQHDLQQERERNQAYTHASICPERNWTRARARDRAREGHCSSFDPAKRIAEHSVDNPSFERPLPNFQTPSRQKAHGVGLQEIKHPTRLSRSSKPYGEEVEIVLRKRIQRRVAKMEWEVALPPRSSDITGGPRQGVGEIVIETVFFATSQRAPAARILLFYTSNAVGATSAGCTWSGSVWLDDLGG
ncbi:hypothetical protein BJ912DRAFT_1062951 [Pholiota molesta]|nr:hypothetical protein BJ912DRAFT_1062951 [Pholiota molesta]